MSMGLAERRASARALLVAEDVLQFEVCPETCEVMRADGGQVQLVFGCSSGLPPLQ